MRCKKKTDPHMRETTNYTHTKRTEANKMKQIRGKPNLPEMCKLYIFIIAHRIIPGNGIVS